MKQIRALYLTNAREFLRVPLVIILVVVLPLVLVLFFGMLFDGGDDPGAVQLGVVNEDAGAAGQQVLSGWMAPGTQHVVNVHTGLRADMLAAMDDGEVSLVVVLPQDLTAKLSAGDSAEVDVMYDDAKPASAGAGLSTMQSLLNTANLELSGAQQHLLMNPVSRGTDPLRTIDVQMPGLLGVALLWLGLFGTALPLMNQRASLVLRRLSITPLRPATMLTAQVAWRMTVALVQAGLFLLVGYFAFKIGVVGNKLLFIAAVTLGALVFISLGYLMAGLASTEEALMGMIQLVNLPMMFLSGGLVPQEILPGFFKPVTRALPLTYLTDALGQLMVGTPPVFPLWLDFAALGGFLVVSLVLAVRFWRWE